jgi:hypothetical protein
MPLGFTVISEQRESGKTNKINIKTHNKPVEGDETRNRGLMSVKYTHSDCLQNSYKINWRIRDVLGDEHFDKSRHWLPQRLSGAGGIPFLTDREKACLTHVEMGAYAHLFGYVEEFIAPEILSLAKGYEIEERAAFDALANFAAEEVKHMTLFREIRDRVDETLGFRLRLLEGPIDTEKSWSPRPSHVAIPCLRRICSSLWKGLL